MGIEAYRVALRHRTVRRVLLLGIVMRVPLWATNVVLTLHVVGHLHRNYAAAGSVAAVSTIALAISAPWRGRRLDRVGLRRVVGPSLFVFGASWAVAPFVGYVALLPLVAVAGLFSVPSFSIIRQALIGAVGERERKTVLAMDSVAIEMSFMVGPAAGVLLATYLPTPVALLICAMATLAANTMLWLVNPPLRSAGGGDGPAAGGSRFGWVGVESVAVLAMATACVLVLSGTDVAIVAALRHLHHQAAIGWVLALWGLGSAIGGFVYGALRRGVPVAALLGLLAATTAPVALARGPLSLAALCLLTGVFCAPTITATLEALSRVVPERVRGEALGWHGSAMTVGSALGAPLAGVAVDAGGWRGGFVVPALVGVAAAAAGALALSRHRAGRLAVNEATGEPADATVAVPAPESMVESTRI